MAQFENFLKILLEKLFSTRAAGMYMLLFAAAIGIGTFIENDFGTSSAQHVVYKSHWFSLLLALFCGSIIANIFKFRMIQQKRWAILTFHTSMIIILIGAAVTRYIGYEGLMHIRENDSSNTILSAETFVQLQLLKDGERYKVDEQVLFSTLGNNSWEQSYLLGKDLIEMELLEFIPNPVQKMKTSESGLPTIKVVFGGANGREEYFINQGDGQRIRGTVFNFTDQPLAGAINIDFRNGELLIQSDQSMTNMVMATQETDTIPGSQEYRPLKLRSMYNTGASQFVFGDFNEAAEVVVESENQKVRNESMTALRMAVKVNGTQKELIVTGKKNQPGRPAVADYDGIKLAVYYGAKEIVLPFSIKLDDFTMTRNPGTNSPASFESEVQLIDERAGIKEDHHIFMNNVLDHDGYRFFQSSYDQDELGTVLSVNHDFWGTWITYVGYILLTIGLVLSLFSKKSRYHKVQQSLKKMRAQQVALLLISLLSFSRVAQAQEVITPKHVEMAIDAEHAKIFSEVMVQDFKGRVKPFHTLSREIMRKAHRSESLDGLNADQIILGMFARTQDWRDVPFVKLGKHEKFTQILNVSGSRATYADFFGKDGSYILAPEVRRANALKPIDRGVFEKELLKIDERVNILHMVFSGLFLKLVPLENDDNNTWVGPHSSHGNQPAQSAVADRFFPAYKHSLQEAIVSKDYTLPNKLLSELNAYQKDKGAAVMPNEMKLNAELLLNNLNVFNRLAGYYAILGIFFLFFLFYSVFKPSVNISLVFKILLGLTILGFFFHTLGLSLRWYVAGRAPWSNGYESMIYIAWTTVLAGLLFSRKSTGALAATMVQSSTILLVALLSYMDPEITPLVPVLRSYWLSIHVSLEAGSYGFLMLGAVIGLINMLLIISLNKENEKRIYRIVKEMSFISELTLTGGLIMVSVGTYLGGVWANESWGRYWGWDAKETWALVTILVYAFILHMRIIPKMNKMFAYNFATIFGLGSVIMTYYGVNYYLSGLHSYAAGDPAPIPDWVSIAVVIILLISALAWWRKRKFKLIS